MLAVTHAVAGPAIGKDAIHSVEFCDFFVDLGHELFVWFLFVPAVMAAAGHKKNAGLSPGIPSQEVLDRYLTIA